MNIDVVAPYLELPGFTVDVRRRLLLRRESGEVIALNAKVFDTLLYLAQHPGEVLDKDTLLSAVWPGVVVEENSLAQNVSALRQALGETHGENRYIATVPRRGYRFVAEVHARSELPAASDTPVAAHSGTSSPRAIPRPWWIGAMVLAVALLIGATWFWRAGEREEPAATPGALPALAVLPFKPLVLTERDESLELGMTDSLIAKLSELDGHVVRPLSSVRRYAAPEQDALAAARALDAQVVLDGFLQHSGGRLRVTTRLLDVKDGRQIWAGSFDETFTTIFEVQDTIARRVSEALRAPLSDRAARRSERGSTQNSAAYLAHANGKLAWSRLTRQSLNQAIGEFEKALALDPRYALAYVGIADSYATLGVFGVMAPHDAFPRARRAAQQALAIESGLAAAHATLGHITVQYDLDWITGMAEYERAIALDPGYARTYHWRGLSNAMHGATARAIADFEHARQLEPLWIAPRAATGNILFYARRYKEAIAELSATLELDERADNARTYRARAYLHSGQRDLALAEFLKLREREARTPGSFGDVGQALALLGRTDEARAELARLVQLATTRYVPALDIATIHASLGDRDSAFQWLERAYTDRSTNISMLEYDPSFDALHDDARFAALVERIDQRKRKDL
ncbi:MAG TPA: winged helix-turn-helix domain-containing protein [Steroidobacteraceae bacterium]|nr:winged helix-turn-helix domain-containing protein [Steroidobacteraceae bacterium]